MSRNSIDKGFETTAQRRGAFAMGQRRSNRIDTDRGDQRITELASTPWS